MLKLELNRVTGKENLLVSKSLWVKAGKGQWSRWRIRRDVDSREAKCLDDSFERYCNFRSYT